MIERLVPSEINHSNVADVEQYRLHVERYDFAAKFVFSGRILDCACGVGYGAEILAQAGDQTQSVTGVDIDAAAIDYARANYGSDRLEFIRADGTNFDSEPFDTIVSFETIEHVPDPGALVENLTRLLKPTGTIIASVPVTPSVDVNPFHLHDFTEASFRRMFENWGFSLVDSLLQRQRYEPFKRMATKSSDQNGMRQNLLGYYLTHPSAAAKRLYSTAVDGFCNKYLTCAWRR